MSGITGYRKNWYKEWFGEDYVTVYKHRDAHDAGQLAKLIRSQVPVGPESYILDVACGTGRHARHFLPLTTHIFGIDLSAVLLREARCAPSPPFFIRADMRHLPVLQTFDLVLSLFTSFGYFEDDHANQQVVAEMSRVVKPGGFLVIDYLNPDYVSDNLVPEGQRVSGDMTIAERRWISDGRIQKEIRVSKGDECRLYYESVRLYRLAEMKRIMENAGVMVFRLFGEYDGRAYHSHSSRMILFGKRSAP